MITIICHIKTIYLILAGCSILAAAMSLCLLAKRNNLSWTGIMGLAVSLFVSVNILVFYNPLFFTISSKTLVASDIGWRQADALRAEIYRFKKNVATDFAAVGSSQTGAIYIPYTYEETNLSVLTMAGMGPLDFLLYKNIIRSLCKHTVILTLSDFDLGRKPSLLGPKLAPPQGIGLYEIISLLRHDPSITYAEIQDLLLANMIDAYRYQYIFRGYLDKAFGRNNASPSEDVTTLTDEEFLRIHLQNLLQIDRRWFPVNLLLLERFLAWTGKNKRQVVIVEGHYHPRALARNEAVHAEASAQLKLVCRKFNNCSYLQNSQLYEFSESDYRDGYHVREEAGKRFTEALMKEIRW